MTDLAPLALVPALAIVTLGTSIVVAWQRRSSEPDVPLRSLEFVAIDLETTGLDVRTAAPVAMAAIPFTAGRPAEEAAYVRLVNPGRPIPPASTAVHGIDDVQVRGAPSIDDALPGLLETCRGRPIVAHTAAYDLGIVNRCARGARLSPLAEPVLDVAVLAHALFPSWWDLTLEGLGRLLEVPVVGRHTADGDALTAGLIFVRLIPILEERGAGTLAGARRLGRRGRLIPVAPGSAGGGLAGP